MDIWILFYSSAITNSTTTDFLIHMSFHLFFQYVFEVQNLEEFLDKRKNAYVILPNYQISLHVLS